MKLMAYKYDEDGIYDLVFKKANGYHYQVSIKDIAEFKHLLRSSPGEVVKISNHIQVDKYIQMLDNKKGD